LKTALAHTDDGPFKIVLSFPSTSGGSMGEAIGFIAPPRLFLGVFFLPTINYVSDHQKLFSVV
jgi:hypothetical protein